MKAKVIDTHIYQSLDIGEIVEIIPGMEADSSLVWNAPNGRVFLCKRSDGTFEYALPGCLQILPEEQGDGIDWSAFRREAAKDILAGAMSGQNTDRLSGQQIVTAAINFADELIRQLKEGK